ncbi:MAG: hypothetical protein KAR83_08100 [Thermodesulfovibrionales bacterium]|nr:hypothetical protein [Thermodesulfovibrionales bacterium]
MKTKTLRIGVKSVEQSLDEFASTAEAIERGEGVRKSSGVFFASLSALRKSLTPKRLELLALIMEREPESLNELARLAKRNIKNVFDDITYLEQVGMLSKVDAGRETVPVIDYDSITVDIDLHDFIKPGQGKDSHEDAA